LVRRLDDSGGQATVHLGRSVAPPHHEAAIKIYHSALRSTRDRQRFQREVEAMARLASDPHIIDVYDVGVLDNGQAYLAMRLCSGGSLATMLAERGPMSPAAVISLGETLAEALGRAHRHGVLHRDVKPHNILLTDDGSPVLADFGIVALRHHEPAATVGRWTASYAAPELFHDEPATVRTDIYGLGATLYTMLCGRPPHHDPWRNPSPAELLWRRAQQPERIDGVPEKLMNVILQALSPAPDERFATADAFAAALRESAEQHKEAKPSKPVHRLVLPGVDPAHRVTLQPSIQPGMLATAAGTLAATALWSLVLDQPGWTVTWVLLTVLIGVLTGFGRLTGGFIAFAASLTTAFVISVRAYDDEPLWSVLWILAAFGAAVLAGAWGRTTSALKLRWFALRHRVLRRRWFGQASVRTELTDVEAVPAARLLRLTGSTCHYAVVCGDAVALVRWASWPDGAYIATDETVRRDGQVWPHGGRELARARRGRDVLEGITVARRRVFLAVDSPGEVRLRDLRDELTIVHSRELAENLGLWLSAEPYEINLELLAAMIPATTP
jgi:hypothetical protein